MATLSIGAYLWNGPSIMHKITPCWVTLLQTARRAAVLGQPSSLRLHFFVGGPTYHTDALCMFLNLDTNGRVERGYLRGVRHMISKRADLTSKKSFHSLGGPMAQRSTYMPHILQTTVVRRMGILHCLLHIMHSLWDRSYQKVYMCLLTNIRWVVSSMKMPDCCRHDTNFPYFHRKLWNFENSGVNFKERKCYKLMTDELKFKFKK